MVRAKIPRGGDGFFCGLRAFADCNLCGGPAYAWEFRRRRFRENSHQQHVQLKVVDNSRELPEYPGLRFRLNRNERFIFQNFENHRNPMPGFTKIGYLGGNRIGVTKRIACIWFQRKHNDYGTPDRIQRIPSIHVVWKFIAKAIDRFFEKLVRVKSFFFRIFDVACEFWLGCNAFSVDRRRSFEHRSGSIQDRISNWLAIVAILNDCSANECAKCSSGVFQRRDFTAKRF